MGLSCPSASWASQCSYRQQMSGLQQGLLTKGTMRSSTKSLSTHSKATLLSFIQRKPTRQSGVAKTLHLSLPEIFLIFSGSYWSRGSRSSRYFWKKAAQTSGEKLCSRVMSTGSANPCLSCRLSSECFAGCGTGYSR